MSINTYPAVPIGTPFGSPGAAITRGDIEQRVLFHISTWIDAYLANQEIQTQGTLNPVTPGGLVRPKSYDVVTDFSEFAEDTMPFIAVISTGTDPGATIKRDGEGNIAMSWLVAIGVLVSTNDPRTAKALAGYYGAAIRLMFLQMPELGGWAAGTEIQDERYDDWKRTDNERMAAVRSVFSIEVPDVANVFLGFRDLEGGFVVPADPYTAPADFPTVTTPSVDIHVSKPNQPLSDAE